MSVVNNLKLKIMEFQADLSCNEFAKKVIDELGKSIDNQEMKALLSAKLAQIKSQIQEEEKMTEDATSVSQPQNHEDPYERAKQLIDQFQERMEELDQDQRNVIQNMEQRNQYFKSSLEQRNQFLDGNDTLDQQFIQLHDKLNQEYIQYHAHEEQFIAMCKKRLQNKAIAEKELCANLQEMIKRYCTKYKSHIFLQFETPAHVIQTKVPKNSQVDEWVSYTPKAEKLDKLPYDYNLELKKVFWQQGGNCNQVTNLKFSFGQDLDQSNLKVDGMQVKEFQPGQKISKIEYWTGCIYVYGIRFLDVSGQEIVMVGRQDYDKHQLDIPKGNLRGIEVGFDKSKDCMSGLKIHIQEQKNFIKVVEASE